MARRTTRQPSVSFDVVRRVAKLFRQHPHVKSVEIFGPVARDGKGSQVDLLLVVPKWHASRFLAALRRGVDRQELIMIAADKVPVFSMSHRRVLRTTYALRTLGAEFGRIMKLAQELLPQIPVSVLLVPEYWRNDLGLVTSYFGTEFADRLLEEALEI